MNTVSAWKSGGILEVHAGECEKSPRVIDLQGEHIA